jgi:ubiquinone/menaquinone biosynthesis C-methylase UbiE
VTIISHPSASHPGDWTLQEANAAGLDLHGQAISACSRQIISLPPKPTFEDIFPTTPNLATFSDRQQQADHNLIIIPMDEQANVLCPVYAKVDSLPISVGGATPQNFLSLTSATLRRAFGRETIVTDICPVAILAPAEHNGIVIRARVLPRTDVTPKRRNAPNHWESIPVRKALFLQRWSSVRPLLESSLQTYKVTTDYYDKEIAIYQNLQRRYRLHRELSRRLLIGLANIASKNSTADLATYLVASIVEHLRGGPFIDVACGDSSLVFHPTLVEAASWIVRNDVSCHTALDNAQVLKKTHAAIVTTCLDARRLPFMNRQFSVGICKNAIHHMPSHRSAVQLLSELVRITRTAVICEILNPTVEEGQWGRLRHFYYRRYLPDPGERFLGSHDFDKLLSDIPQSMVISRQNYLTVNGVYACAILRCA